MRYDFETRFRSRRTFFPLFLFFLFGRESNVTNERTNERTLRVEKTIDLSRIGVAMAIGCDCGGGGGGGFLCVIRYA